MIDFQKSLRQFRNVRYKPLPEKLRIFFLINIYVDIECIITIRIEWHIV